MNDRRLAFPPPPPEPEAILRREVSALRRENARLRAASDRREQWVDPVSGLFDGRYFFRRLGQEIARSQRTGRPMSVVVTQIAELRRIGEIAGRRHGRNILQWAVDLLEHQTRDCDVTCRIGPHELALVLPETPVAGAEVLVQRLTDGAEASRPPLPGPLRAKLQFGAACYPDDGETAIELVLSAEERMLAPSSARSERRVA